MKLYNMFNTQNSENQILLSGTYFRPNKGMPSPPPSGVSMKESRPIRDKPVSYLQAGLGTADAIQVDASLPPKIFFGGRAATTGNESAVRRLACMLFTSMHGQSSQCLS